MKTEAIVVRVVPSLKRRLEQVAQCQEITLSEVIRAACEDYTAPNPKAVVLPIMGQISDKGIVWKSSGVEL